MLNDIQLNKSDVLSAIQAGVRDAFLQKLDARATVVNVAQDVAGPAAEAISALREQKRWTEAETALLRECLARGEASESIAKRLGRTLHAVVRQIAKVKGPRTHRRRFTAEQDEAIKLGLKSGRTVKQIAAALERHPTSVSARAALLGLI